MALPWGGYYMPHSNCHDQILLRLISRVDVLGNLWISDRSLTLHSACTVGLDLTENTFSETKIASYFPLCLVTAKSNDAGVYDSV